MIDRRTFILLAVAAALAIGSPSFSQAAERLNPNNASAEQLKAVPGLDPSLAAAIQQQRPFDSMVEFDELVRQTLSEDEAEALYENLFIPVNLNTGDDDEIALIPGITDHMIDEFLEYRPYSDMETFNREIGKYVDEDEVARLRSYVTL